MPGEVGQPRTSPARPQHHLEHGADGLAGPDHMPPRDSPPAEPQSAPKQDHNSTLGRLNTRFHVQQRLSSLLSSKGTALVGGVLGAGALVLSAASSMLVVIVLVVYFLAAMPRIKLFAYRLAPQSRRARVILTGDEIFDKVGGYMLGNFLTCLIAGVIGVVAIPAAALRLLLHEVTFRRLDTS